MFKFHQHVVQILLKECVKKLQASNVNISNHGNGNIKNPIGISIFVVNLTLKLFRVNVADSCIGTLMALHTFL